MSTKRSSKKFRLMEDKKSDTSEEEGFQLLKSRDSDHKSSSTSNEEEEEEGYVVLDLHSSKDLENLEKTFETLERALSTQKGKLASKWDLLGSKPSIIKTKNETNETNEKEVIKMKHSLLIDLKHLLERIERIGMLKGQRFGELEKEQDKAIEKLTSVVDLEEDARISRNRAIEIQKETELEMAQIDSQRQIIKTELDKAEPQLQLARAAVEDINDSALNELISLKKPPETVVKVLTVAVWIVNSAEIKAYDIPPLIGNAQSAQTERGTRGRRGRGRTNTLVTPKTPQARSRSRDKDKKKKSKGSSKSPRPQSKRGDFKEKRKRAQSTGLNNIPHIRSKTPMSSQFDNDNSNRLSLTPLSESQSEIKARAKSKNNLVSPRDGGGGGSGGGKHRKNGSKLTKKSKSDKFNKILEQSWQDTRKMLRGNFKKSVLAFDPKTLDKAVCHRIENEFLNLEDFTVERAYTASKVLGPLVKWIRSLVGYTHIWYQIEPMANKVTSLELALDVKKLEVKRLKNVSQVSHEKVIKIRGEMLKMVGYHKIGDLYFLS